MPLTAPKTSAKKASHGPFLLRALGIAALVGLAVGLYLGIAHLP